jgi:hypothetical protein
MCYRHGSRAVTPVSQEPFSYDCCSGLRQRTLWTAKPEDPCDVPCRNASRAVVRRRRPAPPVSINGAAALPGPELTDLVTSGYREDALDRGERRPGGDFAR